MHAGALEQRREPRGHSFRWLVRIPTPDVERPQSPQPQAAKSLSTLRDVSARRSFEEPDSTAEAARLLRDHTVTSIISVSLLVLALVLYSLPLPPWVNGIAIPLAVIAGAVSLSELLRIPAARRSSRQS